MFDSLSLTSPAIQWITIAVGIAILLFGRRMFWLLVAAIGFMIGLELSVQFFDVQQFTWLILAIALLAGVLGAAVAVFVQHVAVAIAGFLGGGYVLLWLLNLFVADLGQGIWLLIFIAGGLVGVFLSMFLFNTALILLSSVAGATLIVQMLPFEPLIQAVLFIILVVVGIVVQAGLGGSGSGG